MTYGPIGTEDDGEYQDPKHLPRHAISPKQLQQGHHAATTASNLMSTLHHRTAGWHLGGLLRIPGPAVLCCLEEPASGMMM